jgi:hypothetical protein
MISILAGRRQTTCYLPPERYYVGKRKEFWIYSSTYDYKVQESPPNTIVTRKPIVCESSGKGLVVQEEDESLLIHPT